MPKLAAFLRGINVGGRHKVPMPELRLRLQEEGCRNVKTLLNTGNAAFDSDETDLPALENKLETALAQTFGFPVPVILRPQSEICELVQTNPFAGIDLHKDLRLYVTFLKQPFKALPELPYVSKDYSYKIISAENGLVLSVLDISLTGTTQGMDDLEKLFGKNVTTRNWNTLLKMTNIF